MHVLTDLPPEVAFESVIYRLAIAQVPVSGTWQLKASWSGGNWLCAFSESEEKLRREIYEEGLDLERATVPLVIFERLVKEGRAEVVKN